MKVECNKCKATGLYCGFAEPEGTAVICRDCKGTGGVDLKKAHPSQVEYTGRKQREGIQRVYVDQGLWMSRTELDERTSTVPLREFYTQVPAEGFSGDGSLSGKYRSIDE